MFLSCNLASGQTMVGVMETSFKRIYANSSQDCCSQYPKTHGRPLSTHSSTRNSRAHTGILAQSLVGLNINNLRYADDTTLMA